VHNLRCKVFSRRTDADYGKKSWGLDARIVCRAASRAHMCNCRTTVSRALGATNVEEWAPLQER
jgi:hypothetical protein